MQRIDIQNVLKRRDPIKWSRAAPCGGFTHREPHGKSMGFRVLINDIAAFRECFLGDTAVMFTEKHSMFISGHAPDSLDSIRCPVSPL